MIKKGKKMIKEKQQSKKSPEKRKNQKGLSDKWYNLNEILVYNGMGLKGEVGTLL